MKRCACTLLLLVLLLAPLALALDTLYESYEDLNTSSYTQIFHDGTNDNRRSQAFTPGTSHTITSVDLNMQEQGTVGVDLIVEIYASGTGADDNKPTGSVLAAGALTAAEIAGYAWVNCDLTTTAALTAGTKYCIVLCTTAGDIATNYYAWRRDNAGTYAGGAQANSTDGGATWTVNGSYDVWFREYGTPTAGAAVPGISHRRRAQ